jgi:hypothetical protein
VLPESNMAVRLVHLSMLTVPIRVRCKVVLVALCIPQL